MSLDIAIPQLAIHAFEHEDVGRGAAPARPFGTTVRFGRNTAIFSRGDEARYVYKVVSGAVRLSRVMLDGRRWVADFVFAGDLFGFDMGESYTTSAETIGEVCAIRYLRSQIDGSGGDQPGLGQELVSILRRGLSEAQNRLMILTRQTAAERVASFLLRLAERGDAQDGDAVEVPVRRQDIADYLGLTTETVCRAISEFCRARILSVPNRRHVIVHDLERLRALSGGAD